MAVGKENLMQKRTLYTIALLLGGLTAFIYMKNNNVNYPITDKELSRTSVMITRLDGRSGGSGVIIESDDKGSKVLTNAHVCEVVQNGGRLKTETKIASVTSYQVSELHDLCLISTKSDLGVSTKVSSSYSEPFTPAIVVGHPKLLSTIVTRGHFSHYSTIQVMTGIRACTEEEVNSDLGFVCMLLGGLPVIKTYETQVISATIQAGSSGSPVFNSEGEIGGLVFAGSGDLSYAFIVPQEYVLNFLESEIKTLKSLKPNYTLDITESMKESRRSRVKKFMEKCESEELNNKVKEVCKSINRSVYSW